MQKESIIETQITMDFDAVEQIILDIAKKQNLEYKGQKIKVDAVKLQGFGEQLKINVNTSGAFDGTITLIGKPQYSPADQSLFLADVDIDLQGNNFFSKAIVVFLGGIIEQKITPLLKFPIKEQIGPLNHMLNHIPITLGLFAQGKINEFDVPKIDILSDQLILHLSLKGNLEFKIKYHQA